MTASAWLSRAPPRCWPRWRAAGLRRAVLAVGGLDAARRLRADPARGPGDARGARHVVVEVPTTSGAIATDRILVKPNRLQAAYLPGARWVDGVRRWSRRCWCSRCRPAAPSAWSGAPRWDSFPTTRMLTEVRAFQAEPGPPEGPAYVVRIALTMTVLREADGTLVATPQLRGATAGAPSDEPLALASAFDAAMATVLREAVAWIAAATGGAV